MAKRSHKTRPKPGIAPASRSETRSSSPLQLAALPWRLILQALVIVAAGCWIYAPVLHGDWLMDDDAYITKNALLRDPFGLLNIWLLPGSFIEYYPINSSVEWFEFQFCGLNPFGYHVVNIILHIISSLLVWGFFRKLGLRLAWLGGLIFAVHPVQVESVAWVSELKNVISLPPFLLAMGAWVDFEERGRDRDYLLAVGFFLIAMLCKISMVLFPVVILLYAWWKRGRIGWKDLITSSPFFAISLALGLLTIVSGTSYTPGHALEVVVPLGGVLSQLACVGLAVTFYLLHPFIPVPMLPMYPHWILDPPSLVDFLPWPFLAAGFYWVWTQRRGWGRHVLLGLGFFLINLAPFVGFQKITFMRFTWVMDHFLYLPILGLLGLVLAGLGQIDERLSAATRPYRIGAVAVAVALLTIQSHSYAGMFINQETLWTYTIQRNPEAWPAHNNLGNCLYDEGRMTDAMEQYQEALRIKPDYTEAHNNLGNVLVYMGRKQEAMVQYQEALNINPDLEIARENLDKVQASLQAAPANH